MRELTRHKDGGLLNEQIRIFAGQTTDAPGGGCHSYAMKGPDSSFQGLEFQNGPLSEVGINGLSDEAVLAVIIDRLEQFQEGGLHNRHTAVALTKLEEALMWLRRRKEDRRSRQVEGTYSA